jgi:GTP-binding protein
LCHLGLRTNFTTLKVKNVEYIGSYHKESMCPTDNLPEFAFIGRSNVGKSSLINMIMEKKDLARVSKQPGKTQSLNFFKVDDNWFLVDLPGYGYAKASHSNRDNWGRMIKYYLKNRNPLFLAFVLIDSRHSLQKVDKEFLDWCGENEVPFAIVYTKTDKVHKAEVNSNIAAIRKELLTYWESLPPEFVTSSEDKIGREEILTFVGELINNK